MHLLKNLFIFILVVGENFEVWYFICYYEIWLNFISSHRSHSKAFQKQRPEKLGLTQRGFWVIAQWLKAEGGGSLEAAAGCRETLHIRCKQPYVGERHGQRTRLDGRENWFCSFERLNYRITQQKNLTTQAQTRKQRTWADSEGLKVWRVLRVRSGMSPKNAPILSFT